MPMTERAASALVDVLLRAYPTYPADSATRQLYEHALTNDKHDEAVATAAVQSWIVNTAVMPKINELLDAIKVESASRRIDDSERRRIAGALPPGVEAAPRSVAATLRIKLMRQVRNEMTLTAEQRVRMSPAQRAAYSERFAARLDELVAQHPELTPTEPLETFVCQFCQDVGWINESLVEGQQKLRPCVCQPELYDRWRAGHFAPGHDCAACQALRRGKRA